LERVAGLTYNQIEHAVIDELDECQHSPNAPASGDFVGVDTQGEDCLKFRQSIPEVNEYDAFEHLCDAMCISPDTVVAVLTAYFDEAGTDASKPAVAVGCYIATSEQWKCFNYDWRWLRDWSGVGKYFRRTNQESFWLHPETKHWDKAKRASIFQAQHAFIQAHTMAGWAGAVIKTDYDEAIQGVDRTALGTPYEFCLRHCMAGVTRFLAQRPAEDEVLYVIESGAEGEKHLNRAFDLFLADPEIKTSHRLKSSDSWAFLSKEKAMPLQAADALAYETAKEMENRFGSVTRNTRKSLVDLVRLGVDTLGWYPKDKLIEMTKLVHEDARWPYGE
jgi:hypothetical protein